MLENEAVQSLEAILQLDVEVRHEAVSAVGQQLDARSIEECIWGRRKQLATPLGW
jgi:hypothetical protein